MGRVNPLWNVSRSAFLTYGRHLSTSNTGAERGRTIPTFGIASNAVQVKVAILAEEVQVEDLVD